MYIVFFEKKIGNARNLRIYVYVVEIVTNRVHTSHAHVKEPPKLVRNEANAMQN
jgi:hypothetical protein